MGPQESWTYAEFHRDWIEKEVLVHFESGDRISDLCEGGYLVRAHSAHGDLTQEWHCASHPIRTNEIEWDLEHAKEKVMGSDWGEDSEDENCDSDREEAELSNDDQDASEEEAC